MHDKQIPQKVTPEAVKYLCPDYGTQIIFQRHCNYDREKGFLIPESVDLQNSIYEHFVKEMKENLTEEQLENTYFLFISSSTKGKNDLQRSRETTKIAKDVIEDYFPKEQIINNTLKFKPDNEDKIWLHKHLIEPKMFTTDQEYLNFLKEKTGGNLKDVFIAFEDDVYEKERKEMNAEGPDEIVERIDYTISALDRYSKQFHENNPDSQLIIVAGTHYDTLSPYTKKLYDMKKTDGMPVDYCGAVSITIDKYGNKTATVNNDTINLQEKENTHKPDERCQTPGY